MTTMYSHTPKPISAYRPSQIFNSVASIREGWEAAPIADLVHQRDYDQLSVVMVSWFFGWSSTSRKITIEWLKQEVMSIRPEQGESDFEQLSKLIDGVRGWWLHDDEQFHQRLRDAVAHAYKVGPVIERIRATEY